MQLSRKAAPLLGLATLAALGLAAHPAQAQNFNYTFTGGGGIGTASGSLAATPAAGPDSFGNTNYFQANSGGGTFAAGSEFAGDTLTLLANPNAATGQEAYSPSGQFIYDDELFPNQPSMYVDNGGLLFTFHDNGAGGAPAGNYELNVFTQTGSYQILDYTSGVGYTPSVGNGSGTFTLSTPEPSSVAAFAFTGLGAAGLMLKARKRKANAA